MSCRHNKRSPSCRAPRVTAAQRLGISGGPDENAHASKLVHVQGHPPVGLNQDQVTGMVIALAILGVLAVQGRHSPPARAGTQSRLPVPATSRASASAQATRLSWSVMSILSLPSSGGTITVPAGHLGRMHRPADQRPSRQAPWGTGGNFTVPGTAGLAPTGINFAFRHAALPPNPFQGELPPWNTAIR